MESSHQEVLSDIRFTTMKPAAKKYKLTSQEKEKENSQHDPFMGIQNVIG